MIISINKAKGPTSHDVIDQLRKILGIKKIGHAGTLDPLASGVLVVAVGRESTKKIDEIVKKEKEYVATVKLGYNSTTDDEEGEKQEVDANKIPSKNEINDVLKKFIGKISQMPPIYSAIKVKGKAAYKYARQGKEVEIKARQVEIKSINVLKYNYPILEISVTTGPGVYIRSLARDIGKKLGTGAYLADLVRTRVGEHSIDKAVKVEEVKATNF